MKCWLFIIIVASCIVLSGGFPVHAEGEAKTALKVQPVMEQIIAKPGEVLKKELTLTNLSTIPLPIKAYARSFVASDEEGGTDYPDDKAPKSVQHWFSVETPDFIIQPSGERKVMVTIQVPPDAEPGGHYATFFFESLVPKEALTANSVYLSTRLGALFFFVIAGDIEPNGKLEQVGVQRFYQQGPISLQMRFQNTGNIHLQPKSTITIKNWRGKVSGRLEDSGKMVLPEKTRTWTIEWNKPWMFGRYSAEIQTDPGNELPKQISTVSWWVLPVWPILGGIFALLFIYFIIIRGRSRWRKAFAALRGKS